jgi:hypothetical protein
VLALVTVVVGVDVLFFRNQFWERLLVNIGIVLVFTGVLFEVPEASVSADAFSSLALRAVEPVPEPELSPGPQDSDEDRSDPQRRSAAGSPQDQHERHHCQRQLDVRTSSR